MQNAFSCFLAQKTVNKMYRTDCLKMLINNHTLTLVCKNAYKYFLNNIRPKANQEKYYIYTYKLIKKNSSSIIPEATITGECLCYQD